MSNTASWMVAVSQTIEDVQSWLVIHEETLTFGSGSRSLINRSDFLLREEVAAHKTGDCSSASRNSDTLSGRIQSKMNLSRNGGRPLISHFYSFGRRAARNSIRLFSCLRDLLRKLKVLVPNWLMVLWRSLCWTGYVFLLWTLFSIVLVLLAAETVPLGPSFELSIGLAVVSALTLALLVSRIQPRNKPENKISQRVARRWTIAIAVFGLAVTVIGMTPTVSDHLSRPADADAARTHYLVSETPDLEPKGLERTLAEIERSRRQLGEIWPTPSVSIRHISLELFGSLEQYHAVRGLEHSLGATLCTERQITIFVPLEEAGNIFSEDNPHPSSTVMHEVVHAEMCRMLGGTAFRSMPLWFHEGMAQLHAHLGISRTDERTLNRALLWFKRGDLPAPHQFCGDSTWRSFIQMPLLYATTWEFVRFLEESKGRNHLHGIVQDVHEGVAFEDSLDFRFGGNCHELYGQWIGSW